METLSSLCQKLEYCKQLKKDIIKYLETSKNVKEQSWALLKDGNINYEAYLKQKESIDSSLDGRIATWLRNYKYTLDMCEHPIVFYDTFHGLCPCCNRYVLLDDIPEALIIYPLIRNYTPELLDNVKEWILEIGKTNPEASLSYVKYQIEERIPELKPVMRDRGERL